MNGARKVQEAETMSYSSSGHQLVLVIMDLNTIVLFLLSFNFVENLLISSTTKRFVHVK